MGAHMRILLPTGSIAFPIVKAAARDFDTEVVVTGEIASFLTPQQLKKILVEGEWDMVLVPGMCTASFEDIEKETGIPIFRGPRHAADLSLILPLIGSLSLSRAVPADEFIQMQREQKAREELVARESSATFDFMLRGLKVGGTSRMKVLAEIMDAHRIPSLKAEVERCFDAGADIVDLGFGFDATPADVERCLAELEVVDRPLAVDSQDPALIRASLGRADLVLSLTEANMPEVGREVASAGMAAVVVPSPGMTLDVAIQNARKLGITRIIADPLLQPVGSGLVESLCAFRYDGCPLFFGAGNVTELIDADSIGVNALLAGIARECGASVIFTSEHSDKTRGSISEMRRAVEMMVLMDDRPYPKDLGIDLLCIKEKRRRREPPLEYAHAIDALPMPEEMVYDPKGNMRIGIEDGRIVAVHHGVAIRGDRWEDVFHTLLSDDRISLLDHAAYLGKELYKAELALRFGRSFEQDGKF
jgi:dihydropteroate synthase-like protein